jgi:hypothetical protein
MRKNNERGNHRDGGVPVLVTMMVLLLLVCLGNEQRADAQQTVSSFSLHLFLSFPPSPPSLHLFVFLLYFSYPFLCSLLLRTSFNSISLISSSFSSFAPSVHFLFIRFLLHPAGLFDNSLLSYSCNWSWGRCFSGCHFWKLGDRWQVPVAFW